MSISNLFAEYGATYIVTSIIVYIILVIANWRIFTKANEAGWKSIIPIYNSYILYKISWKPLYFFLGIILTIAAFVITCITDATAAIIVAFILYILIAIIQIVAQYKLSKAYGHGVGFAIGLIILNPIFTLILGFGKSEYVGNEG